MAKILRVSYTVFLFFIVALASFAENENHDNSEMASEEESFDALGMIMHHISDSHYWHIISFEKKDGSHTEISLPLPVILLHDGTLSVFMSSEFHHGESVVKKGDSYFKLYHDKIYFTNSEGEIIKDEEGHPVNEKPLDFSITKNVASMWMSALIILGLFITAARKYKGSPSMPTGVQSFLEPLITFVRDDIVVEQLGEEKADKYMPYILTIFFFIWVNNLIGMVPVFPGGSNVSGNIAFTSILALFTLILTNINGSKTYWKHIFAPPGIPTPIKVMLVPIEIVSIFTKPFALMIRLFANITAGHIIILSLASLMFVMKTYYIAPLSVGLSLFMSMLELLVGLLQAYIFALLSALFIGMAVKEEH
ncbi:MAG: F0F1 ATP synthase subunit A [Chlorobi bacterium]|nr:F0F1 ATP synthase subunit A [Chlorobiota bacterium]